MDKYWGLLVIVLSLLLMVVLVWSEVKRANKARIAIRIITTVSAVLSLYFIIYPVYINQVVQSAADQPYIILTSGYNKDSVRAMQKQYPQSKVYLYNPGVEAANESNYPQVDHLSELTLKPASLIHLYGEGLEPVELKELEGHSIIFHPPVNYTGLTAVDWTRNIMSGETLKVQGSYANTTRTAHKMVFWGFGNNLDSVIIQAGITRTFQLTAVPKNTGRAVYTIYSLQNKDTVFSNPLPFEVQIAEPISVLLLSSSPDFENKFLKNWLAESVYKVALRTSISSNKYSKEFVNLPALPINNLQPSLLEKFKLIIADARELKLMSQSELSNIQNAINQKGIGLIIRADTALPGRAFYNRNFVLNSYSAETKFLQLHSRDTIAALAPLRVAGSYFLQSTFGTQPIFYDQQNRTLVSQSLYGNGKIIVQPIANTYQWVLSGHSSDYRQFWSTIFKSAAGIQPVKEWWSAGQMLPFVSKPVDVQLHYANDTMPVAQVDVTKVYLQQNARFSNQWSGTYWPRTAGWHSFIGSYGKVFNWYVFDNKDYRTIQGIKKTTSTLQSIQPASSSTNKTESVNQKIPIPPIWFFMLFLASAGFLWFEKKFLQG